MWSNITLGGSIFLHGIIFFINRWIFSSFPQLSCLVTLQRCIIVWIFWPHLSSWKLIEYALLLLLSETGVFFWRTNIGVLCFSNARLWPCKTTLILFAGPIIAHLHYLTGLGVTSPCLCEVLCRMVVYVYLFLNITPCVGVTLDS